MNIPVTITEAGCVIRQSFSILCRFLKRKNRLCLCSEQSAMNSIPTAGTVHNQLPGDSSSYMKFAEMVPGQNNGPAKFNITFNGERSEQSVEPKKVLIKNLKVKSGTNNVVAENNSDKPLYLNLVRKGIPLVSDLSGADKGLNMKIEYLDTRMQPVDHKNLIQGTDFMMVARVTNTTFSRVDNIALTEMVPSGWEIQNTRLFEANYGIKESIYDYRDFRDDRVNTYFSLNQGETKTFVLILNAAYKGEFYQPSVWCEAMYTENCYSRVPGNRVTVTGR